eukprot:453987_1
MIKYILASIFLIYQVTGRKLPPANLNANANATNPIVIKPPAYVSPQSVVTQSVETQPIVLQSQQSFENNINDGGSMNSGTGITYIQNNQGIELLGELLECGGLN